jgi:two-component system chemotaxis sensor kinase CheA
MEQLSQQLDQLSSLVMRVEPTDLQALADAHTCLERLAKVAEETDEMPFEAAQRFERTADAARVAVEKLILNEVDDAEEAIKGLLGTVSDLQKLLGGEAVATPLLDPPAAASAPEADPATPTEPDERVFGEDDLPLLGEFVAEAFGHLETAEQELLRLEDEPENVESISAIFRSFHTIKGVAGFLNLEQIQSLAHAAEGMLDRGRQGQLQITGEAAQLVLESIDRMKALIAAVDAAARQRMPLVAQADETRLAARLAACTKATPTSPAPERRDADRATPATTGPDEAPAGAAPSSAAAPAASAAAGEANIKVSTQRLDKLIDMVGELVIAQSMVSQDCSALAVKDQRLGRHVGELSKIVRELQDLSMSLRMVPVGTVFKKMTRLVRDVARKAGKEVELHITGQETELDRNVVESLGDPLVHMIRNSVDHGVEPPDQRERAGKPRVGRIDLRAFHQGGAIHIEINDDGRGLNREKILAKAIAAGIVAEGQEISDAEVHRLIFHAGLSTAEKVTDISGRGVGMDVVKRNIEALRGRVEIASTPGQGSKFTIRLPLTLAVIDGMVVKVGNQKYIIPITTIEQSLRPTAEQLSTVQGRDELCLVRGALLPIVRLHRLFAVMPTSEDATRSLVVIVQDNDRRCCVLVDELLGQQQVVIKSLGEGIGQLPGISGGAVLGDGNVSLILDVPGLIALASQ